VRVFSVDLDQAADVVAELDAVLTPEEHSASARIRVARASTRVVLGRALGIEPECVSISRVCAHCGHPTHGRPTVSGDPSVAFSVSHSGDVALIAVADGDSAVGIDVEVVRPRRHLGALAARVLNDDEHTSWSRLDDGDEQLRSFLRLWTAKEAYLKALGIGIATRLRDVPARVDGWLTAPIDVGDTRVAAVCVDRPDFEVEQFVLSPLVTSNGGTAR